VATAALSGRGGAKRAAGAAIGDAVTR